MPDIDPELLSGYGRADLLEYCIYKPATVNFLRIDFYAKRATVDLDTVNDQELEESLKSAADLSKRATGGLRLIFGPVNKPFPPSMIPTINFPVRGNESAFSSTSLLPFSQRRYQQLLRAFRLPAATTWNLLTQVSHFQEHRLRDPSLSGYTMRRSTRGVSAMDIALSITYDHKSAVTYALLLGCTESQQGFLYKQLTSLPMLARHPLLLPVLFAEYQHTFLNDRNLYLWNRLLEVETTSGRTGAPLIRASTKPQEEGQVPSCTAGKSSGKTDITNEVLGIIQIATYRETYCETLAVMIDCIQSSLDALNNDQAEGGSAPALLSIREAGQIISASVQFTRRKSQVLLSDFRFIEKRAQAQMTAVYNHTAQQIATASKRDTSAMKAIALLTMFFLPPTFAATFIAMPVFDLSAPSGHPVARGTFWLYWAITAPLTCLVLGLYLAYSWYTERRLSSEDGSSSKKDPPGIATVALPVVSGSQSQISSPNEASSPNSVGAGLGQLRSRFQQLRRVVNDVEVAAGKE